MKLEKLMPLVHEAKDKLNAFLSPYEAYQLLFAGIAITLATLYIIGVINKLRDPRQPGLKAKIFRFVISLPYVRGIARKQLDKAVSFLSN